MDDSSEADVDPVRAGLRSYLSTRRREDVRTLAESFPDQRSVVVDLMDLHGYDADLARALFDEPDRVLSAATEVLCAMADVPGPVHLRVENNPHRCPVSGVRAVHLHELVTVTGRVESVGSLQATATTARYRCPACDASIEASPQGIEAEEPVRCDACGHEGRFEFRPDRSRFVDLQRVALAPSPDGGSAGPRTDPLPTYLDDDLVGTVTEGRRFCVTGVLRTRPATHSNQFALYLDGFGVREEADTARSEAERPEADEVLDSYWDRS